MQIVRGSAWGLLLFLLVVTATILPARAFAADPIDVDAEASLQVVFTKEGQPATGVEFRAYRVAEVDRAVEFAAVAPFDAYGLDLSEPTVDTYRSMATLLPGYIAADRISPTAVALTDASGTATFPGLETGLYLVMGDVFHGYREYLTPEAFMICIPERLDDETWNYQVACLAKYSAQPDAEPVDIEVRKAWKNDSASNRPKSVTVELYDGDKLYDRVVLNKANSWSHSWEGLYGGTIWSISEADVPDGYTVSLDKQGNCFIVTNTADTPPGPPNLPKTGMLWWPVPLLAVAGVLLFVFGMSRRKDSR